AFFTRCRAARRAPLSRAWSGFMSELFQRFDAYKIAASQNTVLWYSYIDAIGEKMITTELELNAPLSFSAFCKKYYQDQEFLYFFDQLHMFIHFMGRPQQPWESIYSKVLSDMIVALQKIEELFEKGRQNLLSNFKPEERMRTIPAELSKSLIDEKDAR